MFAAIALALIVAPTIVDVPRSFPNCAAAVAFASKAPEVGQLSYGLSYNYSRERQFPRDGKVLYRTHLEITNPVITLPQWTWPGSATQSSDFAHFRASVLRHEQGHWFLAQDYIKRDGSEWLPESMTREEAAAHFKASFDAIAAALLKAQTNYDSVTDHGRNQSRAGLFGFAAGDDTLLACQ